MKEMTNWRVRDQMRVISLYDQQAGEFFGKLIPETGWRMTERAVKTKVVERGLWYLKNECYDAAEQSWDYRYEGWVVVMYVVRERKNLIVYALLNFKPV